MKKKVIAALLLVSLVGGSLVGCGSKEISNEYVTVKDYKGLEVDKVESQEVTDEDVENDIQSTLEAYSTSEEVERPVQDGDTVTIDYTGKKDGVEFENGSATEAPLTIGSGYFVPGFEEAIIGHEKGETFDIDVTFPEEYNNADLAGQPVVFTIKLHKIEETSLPELNDEFVASVSEESKTIEEYKKEVKKNLQESNEQSAKQSLQDAVWTALMEHVEVTKYPEDLVAENVESINATYEQMAEYYGMEWEEFLESLMGMTAEQYDEQLDETAKSSVKGQLALELIAEKEKLTPSKDEYQKMYEKYAEDYGYDSVDALLEAATEEKVQQMVLQEVVIEWLVENCKQVEPKNNDASADITDEANTGSVDVDSDAGTEEE